MPTAQWREANKDNGQPPFSALPNGSDMSEPSDVNDGVLTGGNPRTTVRVWNAAGADTFDVEVWQLWSATSGEGWFRNADVGVVTVGAASPVSHKTIEIENRGAIRVYVRAFNIGAGATASGRVSVGTD